jgi:CheY-like chemotaxis protein
MVGADILEDEGFTVLAVVTADEAWPILESRSDISVLFTDINMPGNMDGLTLATRVAEHWPHIRLVLTSGRSGLSSDEVPDHGQFVQKPYRQSELMQAIAHAA